MDPLNDASRWECGECKSQQSHEVREYEIAKARPEGDELISFAKKKI